MESGQRINPPLPLEQIRQFAAEELTRLPAALARHEPADYTVEISPVLRELAASLDATTTNPDC